MLAERTESWFDEAPRKGMQQGMQQCLWKSEAALLVKQLTLRFGALPPEAVERLAYATQDEVDAWGEATLTAPTLSAVFETHRY
jgi:hypothetical protein